MSIRPLGGDEIKRLLPGVNLIQYKQLEHVNRIEDINSSCRINYSYSWHFR